MTAKQRYARYQLHHAAVMPSWSQLTADQQEAWRSFNEEIEDEKRNAVQHDRETYS